MPFVMAVKTFTPGVVASLWDGMNRGGGSRKQHIRTHFGSCLDCIASRVERHRNTGYRLRRIANQQARVVPIECVFLRPPREQGELELTD